MEMRTTSRRDRGLFRRRPSPKKGEAFIAAYEFPAHIERGVRRKNPGLTDDDWSAVEQGLRDWLICCAWRGGATLAMPSRIVDRAWHEFILDSASYIDFCDRAYGEYLHHIPEGDTELDSADGEAEVVHAWDRTAADGVRAKQFSGTSTRSWRSSDRSASRPRCAVPCARATAQQAMRAAPSWGPVSATEAPQVAELTPAAVVADVAVVVDAAEAASERSPNTVKGQWLERRLSSSTLVDETLPAAQGFRGMGRMREVTAGVVVFAAVVLAAAGAGIRPIPPRPRLAAGTHPPSPTSSSSCPTIRHRPRWRRCSEPRACSATAAPPSPTTSPTGRFAVPRARPISRASTRTTTRCSATPPLKAASTASTSQRRCPCGYSVRVTTRPTSGSSSTAMNSAVGVPDGWSEWHGSKRTYTFYGYQLLEDGQLNQYGSTNANPDAPANAALYSTDVYTDKAVELIGRRAPETSRSFSRSPTWHRIRAGPTRARTRRRRGVRRRRSRLRATSAPSAPSHCRRRPTSTRATSPTSRRGSRPARR